MGYRINEEMGVTPIVPVASTLLMVKGAKKVKEAISGKKKEPAKQKQAKEKKQLITQRPAPVRHLAYSLTTEKGKQKLTPVSTEVLSKSAKATLQKRVEESKTKGIPVKPVVVSVDKKGETKVVPNEVIPANIPVEEDGKIVATSAEVGVSKETFNIKTMLIPVGIVALLTIGYMFFKNKL